MFVTGLEFLPVNSQQQNHTVSSVAEAAVLSISVDNQVCIHTLPYRSNVNITFKKKHQIITIFVSETIPLWLAIVVLILTMFLTFFICSYIGL